MYFILYYITAFCMIKLGTWKKLNLRDYDQQTKPMEQSPSREANSLSSSQEIPCFSWNPSVTNNNWLHIGPTQFLS
jgi:hypothetical protein